MDRRTDFTALQTIHSGKTYNKNLMYIEEQLSNNSARDNSLIHQNDQPSQTGNHTHLPSHEH